MVFVIDQTVRAKGIGSAVKTEHVLFLLLVLSSLVPGEF